MQRKTELTILIGINGSGKTTFLRNEIVAKSNKCLIVTPYMDEWKDIPIISYNQIRTFSGTARIIFTKFLHNSKSKFGGL